jgi:hypothetical protein
VLNEAERRLQFIAGKLERVPDFAALHLLVEREIGVMRGIAP